MTRNQILYRQTVETERANRAGEGLTAARDAETRRSNLAKEFETNRSNVAREKETERSNRAHEIEENRSNLARELETSRANRANEGIKRETNTITSAYNQGYLGEFQRSHLAQELENSRHNQRMEEITSQGQDKSLEGTKYSADSSKEASNYSADQHFAGSKYSADKNEIVRMLTNQNNLVLEEMRQNGYNERQLRQIGADAIKVLHDDAARLIQSGAGAKAIRNLVQEYYFKRYGGF